jgi:hypothetical protein
MRRLLLPLTIVALVAAPAVGRADPSLRLRAFSGERAAGPGGHLVPPLQLGSLALDEGSGAAGGTEPVLALVLGIFPGFGLGHYVAGAAWQSWTLIDAILLVGLIVVTAADLGVLEVLAWIATVVERVIEGLDAYHKAGGGRIAARASSRERLAAAGPPDPVRGRVRDAGPRPPEVVLARF